jgi:hypothetical protein
MADADKYLVGLDAWDEFMMGLAQLKAAGMNYKSLAGMTQFSQQKLSSVLKPYEKRYAKICDENFQKLKGSVQRTDPEYDFMIDPRTVLNEMCALLMGGKEIKKTLQQLSDLKETT